MSHRIEVAAGRCAALVVAALALLGAVTLSPSAASAATGSVPCRDTHKHTSRGYDEHSCGFYGEY